MTDLIDSSVVTRTPGKSLTDLTTGRFGELSEYACS